MFREKFNGILCRSYMVPSYTFDNVKGKFPIGFFVWRLDAATVFKECQLDVYDAKGGLCGTKHVSSPKMINERVCFFTPSMSISSPARNMI